MEPTFRPRLSTCGGLVESAFGYAELTKVLDPSCFPQVERPAFFLFILPWGPGRTVTHPLIEAGVKSTSQNLWENLLDTLRADGHAYAASQLRELTPLDFANGELVLGVGDR